MALSSECRSRVGPRLPNHGSNPARQRKFKHATCSCTGPGGVHVFVPLRAGNGNGHGDAIGAPTWALASMSHASVAEVAQAPG